MDKQTITDYSKRSTEELEALLRSELERGDPAVSLAILEVLEARTAEKADTGAAWDSFRKNYLPMADETPLYAEEPARKSRVAPFGRRLGGAAIAACLACMLIVQAGGTDILRTMVHWNAEHFYLDSPVLGSSAASLLPEAGSQDAANKAASSSAPGAEDTAAQVEICVIDPEVTEYASLAEGLAAIGLEELTPTAIPAGYVLDSVQLRGLGGWTDLTACYFDEADHLLRFSYTCHGENSVFSTVVEKDENEVEVYARNGTTYYFLSNLQYESVNWMQDEQTECRISGYVTREELKALIDSMYE